MLYVYLLSFLGIGALIGYHVAIKKEARSEVRGASQDAWAAYARPAYLRRRHVA